MLAPDLVAVFVGAFRDESKRQRDALQAEWAGRERKAAELDRKIASIFRAIEDGLYEPAMKARLVELKQERPVIIKRYFCLLIFNGLSSDDRYRTKTRTGHRRDTHFAASP